MTQKLMKADVLGDALIEKGERQMRRGREIKAMLSDGRIDVSEAQRLAEIALEEIGEAMDTALRGIDAYDVAADAKDAAHTIRCGREAGQTRELRLLDQDIRARRGEIEARQGRWTRGDDTAPQRRGLVSFRTDKAA